MKYTVLAVALLALGGCTSYSKMQTRPVAHHAITSKLPVDYAQCVLPKWLDTNPSAHIVTVGKTTSIIVPVGGMTRDVLMTLDATRAGDKTIVEMRHVPSFSSFPKQWRQAESCI